MRNRHPHADYSSGAESRTKTFSVHFLSVLERDNFAYFQNSCCTELLNCGPKPPVDFLDTPQQNLHES